ncbi:hypothetical protein BH160DRAFT_5191 [Burkholderia sp. H160]|nr:hypothetical protein BH160DRAFT_5191 [Burkholderia sp. H160]
MPQPKAIEYADAPPEVKAVYDDIKATRQVDDVNICPRIPLPRLAGSLANPEVKSTGQEGL